MEYRLGVCSQCGANFKVPASFSADKAKCKVCGGMVEIGPVRSDAGQGQAQAPPVPSRQPPPRQGEASAPQAKAKREGPSMKERLLAQRRAPQQAPSQPVPARNVERARGGQQGRPLPRAGSRSAPTPGPRAVEERGPRKGRTRGRRGTDGSASEGDRSARGRGRTRQKQSPALLITALALVLVAAAAGTWFVLFGGLIGDPESTEGEAAQAQVSTPGAEEPQAEVAAGEESEPLEEPAPDPADEAAPSEILAQEESASDAPQRAQRQADPASIDIRGLEEFGPPDGLGTDEWGRIRDLVANALDPESGIAGSRARIELEGLGRVAFPAIINAMRHLDYSTEQGFRDGDVAQRMLRTIANGRNFNWRYSTEPADEYFNRRVVQEWHRVWARARTDEAFWREFARIPDEPGAAESASETGLSDDDLDDLDDI